jgi:hypothetical protein
VSHLKIKIPSKNMRAKPTNTPIIHSVYYVCMVSPTCFGITFPSSGSVSSAFWEMFNWGAVDRILWMGVLCLVTWCYIARRYVGSVVRPMTCLLPYWRWSGSERNIVAPWGCYCFAEACRSHCKKIKKRWIQCILLVNLHVFEKARYKNKKESTKTNISNQVRNRRI